MNALDFFVETSNKGTKLQKSFRINRMIFVKK